MTTTQKQPKYKVCRKLGSDVYEKCQTQKYQLNEDRKSKTMRRRRRISDYGKQLLNKQKIRLIYGLSEKQFSNYVKEAMTQTKITADNHLYERLEMRLDNIVYRMGLAPTRAFARQLVSHGHIDINGKRIKIPSFKVNAGDKISVRKRSLEKEPFQNLAEKNKDITLPNWLSFDVKKKAGKVTKTPKYTPSDLGLDMPQVIEFYSR